MTMTLFSSISTKNNKERELKDYSDKAEVYFNHVVSALDSIKEEIHKTNLQMKDYSSSTDVKILETKAEMYEKIFTFIDTERVDIDNKIDKKVSKSEVRLVYLVLTTVVAALTWIYK